MPQSEKKEKTKMLGQTDRSDSTLNIRSFYLDPCLEKSLKFEVLYLSFVIDYDISSYVRNFFRIFPNISTKMTIHNII